MLKMLVSRRASTTIMFAVFSGVLAFGILTCAKKVQTVMISQLNKPVTVRY